MTNTNDPEDDPLHWHLRMVSGVSSGLVTMTIEPKMAKKVLRMGIRPDGPAYSIYSAFWWMGLVVLATGLGLGFYVNGAWVFAGIFFAVVIWDQGSNYLAQMFVEAAKSDPDFYEKLHQLGAWKYRPGTF